MLVNSNTSYTPTPGSSSSTSNTLEPNTTSTNSSSSQLHHHLQQSSSSLFTPQQPQQKNVVGCTSTLYARPPSRAHSILDSPTLARVERARLRLEASSQQQHLNDSCGSIINTLNGEDSLERVILDPNKQSLLTGRVPVSSMTGPIKRGLLWQQRDRLFSRWKERYFVLTRDYLHCFKRASGSANERASDMGQFIFKVKLVDVEKVEWLNRRSYSAIGLLLGREGRVLLRCDEGLEDWFELLEECTLTSKERRKALKIAQGPRSRASLAAPVSHASLQSNHFGLGGTYSSALDDWLMTNGSAIGGVRGQKLVKNSMCGYGGTNPFLFSDSVPDLSVLNNENHNHISGLSTNHSTPQKIPYSASNNSNRYSNGYSSQNNSFSNCNGLYGSPRRILINSSFGSTNIVDEETEDGEVELRRPRIFRHLSTENGNELDRDWLYRKPKAPTDMRHSVQPMLPTHNNNSLTKLISDLDCSGHDSGLDTPSSIHRPSSYREKPRNMNQTGVSPRDSIETNGSTRGLISNSSGGSVRAKQISSLGQHASNLNQVNALHGSRYSVQERVLKIRNKEEFSTSNKSANRFNHNDLYDPNQNRYYKNDNQSSKAITPQQSPIKMQHFHSQTHQIQFQAANGNSNDNTANNNNNNNNANNGNIPNGSVIYRERYQHPALTAIINDAQGVKFRDRSFSECQQMSPRRSVNNNPSSPSTSRRNHINPIFGAPTRV